MLISFLIGVLCEQTKSYVVVGFRHGRVFFKSKFEKSKSFCAFSLLVEFPRLIIVVKLDREYGIGR